MATITYNPGNGAFAAPMQTFDINSVVVDVYTGGKSYISFDTDGTMFAVQVTSVTQPDGTSKQMIVGWSHLSGSTILQSGSCMLDLQPFLDILNSAHPSSSKAMAYLYSGDDVLTGSAAKDNMTGGGGNDMLTGNAGNDILKGGDGNDVLTGGAGADQLTGGNGADQFVFLKTNDGADKIADFTHGSDHLTLSAAAFGFTGPLSEGHGFTTGTAATGTGPSLVYDAATGWLGFDPDGAGSLSATTLATLTNHAALTASDILLL